MADKVTTTQELQVKCTLQRDNATTTRTLTVDDPVGGTVEGLQNMQRLREDLISGALSGVVQPSSWRDQFGDEGAYQTTDVAFTLVETTKTEYDLSTVIVPPSVTVSTEHFTTTGILSNFFGGTTSLRLTNEPGHNVEWDVTEMWAPTNEYTPTITATSATEYQLRITPPSSGGETIQSAAGDNQTVVVLKATEVTTGAATNVTVTAVNWTPRVQVTL